MKKYTKFLLKRRRIILLVFSIVLMIAGVYSTKVEINEDLLDYIPSDIESIEAGDIIEDRFDDEKSIRLLLKGIDEEKAIEFTDKIIEENNTALSHRFIDDINGLDSYLFTIVVDSDYVEEDLITLVELINEQLESTNIDGGVLKGTETFEGTDTGMSTTMFVVTIGVIALMILLFSKSYFDVVIILGTVVIAIVLNLGTNYFLGTISSASFTAGSLIQLAVSIDYSLFILTKYNEAKQKGYELDDSIVYAVDKGSKSVMAGAITTVAGFAALLTMKYELGVDLGFVLAKGVLLSLICALTLVPIFIKISHKILDKTEHKSYIPKMKFLSKGVGSLLSPFMFILIVVVALLTFDTQSKADFKYGDPQKSEDQVYVEENFELSNMLILLLPYEEMTNIPEFLTDLEEVDNIVMNDITNKQQVLDWNTLYTQTYNLLNACTYTPELIQGETCGMLPLITPETIDYVTLSVLEQQGVSKSMFIDENEEFVRLFIYIEDNLNELESDEIFNTIKEIRELSNTHFDDEYVTGESAALYDLKEVSTADFKIVSIVSITLVTLVVMISFKSISIPFLLVIVIQTAIWLNMSFAVVTSQPLLFLGYLMVSSVQLGATIDYSILITENYTHNRFIDKMDKITAIKDALEKSIHPVLVSAFALAVGGFVLMFMSTGSNAELGKLIGRGALMSIMLSLLILPHLLVLFDKLILKTTKK